ncbi:CHAT domain-containing protein [uncultured Zobellia sp.]|uniref:CHAT domain-containing protein n=1 Tax=uncultured Zobellia sp. TaxID=255433 RepID=UPI0025929596|nr:CHAT domain-containing protein [uncultured Zobellia sp.]
MIRTFYLISFLFLSLSLFAQGEDYDKRMDDLFDKGYGHLYSNQDSSLFYFDKIYGIAVLEKDWSSVADALTGKNWLAEYQNNLQTLKNNLTALDSLFFVQENYFKNLPEYELYKNDLFYQKGQYFFQINDFENARNEFHKILEYSTPNVDSEYAIEKFEYISTAYSYLAKMYADEGKLNLANTYYERNIRFLKQNLPNEKILLYDNYDLIAEVLKKKKQYKAANSYLLKNLKYILKQPEENSIPKILNIVQNHNNLAQLDSSAYYLNIAENLLSKHASSIVDFYQVSAETKQHRGEYIMALEDYEKALKLSKEKWEGRAHWENAHILNKMGLLHVNLEQYGKAVDVYNQAIEQLLDDSTEINQRKLVQILKNKSLTLNKISDSDHIALQSVELGIGLLDSLKPTFKNHSDKLLLIDDVYPLIESGLNALYSLYNNTGESNHIDQAFRYSETSKSVILLEALLSTKATQFGNIPPELLERESQLKSEIVQLEKKINYAQEKTDTLKELLFELKQEHRKLIADLEANYNDYFNLKYNTKTISLQNLQEELGEDEKLISYFYGNHDIYVVSVTKGEKQLGKIPITEELETRIKSAYKDLADPQSDIKELSKKTYQLYNRLLAPFITETDQELTLITDGLLNYIPFSALNTNNNDLTYLIEHSAIRYSNSATLLSELRNRPVNTPNVLAVAPSFDGTSQVNINRSALSPLPHNSLEAKRILSTFEGHSLLKNDASLENFKKEHKKYGILHLATHAIFNDSTPEYSYLAFSQNHNNNNEDLLFVADLYTLRTDADLITLSACETGIGELRRGEGFMGLSRGFFYGGASSIASTLWKVNDASSANLMGLFYTHLSKGESKGRAMQNAQITFLQNNSQNALAHPYYWSGYVLSGNSTPVLIKYHWGYWIIGAVVLALLGFWAFTKKNKIS